MIYGDGYQGYSDGSPYDGIIVTAGATEVPENLLSQLKLNGKMVIPLGNDVQKMLLYTKTSDANYDVKDFGDFQFVPMLKDKI
jgi:protein-L-isoaspartate(D-aspartate) O-methyltransferase